MLTVVVAVVVLLGLGIAGTLLARRRAARVAQEGASPARSVAPPERSGDVAPTGRGREPQRYPDASYAEPRH